MPAGNCRRLKLLEQTLESRNAISDDIASQRMSLDRRIDRNDRLMQLLFNLGHEIQHGEIRADLDERISAIAIQCVQYRR
ncbi:MAG: hypothetical protein AAF270_06650 [Pseudomonadota bacterium]